MKLYSKKVGIITTHRANNFGAVLQAYALVSACRALGADAEIIDWRNRYYEWLYHSAWRMRRNPIWAIKHLIWYLTGEKLSRKLFDTFRSRIPISDPVFNHRQLQNLETSYQCFIVGSDQIWNPRNSAVDPCKFDRTNLLDFVTKNKKCAYAASIGVTSIRPKHLVNEFVSAWKKFDIITMREHEGAKYVGLFIHKNIDAVLDPVLLHDRDFWVKRESKLPMAEKSYILIYDVKRSSFLRSLAQERSMALGLEIVDLIIPAQVPNTSEKRYSAGPSEFLAYINHAESVFTNSFHASAFATIFGKRLFMGKRDSVESANSRMDSLIRYVELNSVSQKTAKDEVVIEFDCALKNENALKKMQKFSLRYLQEMVK